MTDSQSNSFLQNKDITDPIIAIFGSAASSFDPAVIEIAEKVGQILAKNNVVVATGGCTGIPSIVARAAQKNGAKIMAFYPDAHEEMIHHNRLIHHNDNSDIYDFKYYFTGFSERSLAMIKVCDMAVVVNGRIGTLSEWTMAAEEGLPTIVIKSGGVSEIIPQIIKEVQREFSEDKHIYITSVDELEVSLVKILKGLKY